MSPLIDPPPMSATDTIGHLVGASPVTVGETLTLRSVAAVLADADIGAALVHREGGGFGIVSERDVTRALAGDADPDVVWSADVMSAPLITAGLHEPILRVAQRMIDTGIRHIGIVGDGGEVVGVVSSRDVFQVFTDHALAGS